MVWIVDIVEMAPLGSTRTAGRPGQVLTSSVREYVGIGKVSTRKTHRTGTRTGIDRQQDALSYSITFLHKCLDIYINSVLAQPVALGQSLQYIHSFCQYVAQEQADRRGETRVKIVTMEGVGARICRLE